MNIVGVKRTHRVFRPESSPKTFTFRSEKKPLPVRPGERCIDLGSFRNSQVNGFEVRRAHERVLVSLRNQSLFIVACPPRRFFLRT